jgi:hypothetical protein
MIDHWDWPYAWMLDAILLIAFATLIVVIRRK